MESFVMINRISNTAFVQNNYYLGIVTEYLLFQISSSDFNLHDGGIRRQFSIEFRIHRYPFVGKLI